MFVLWCICLCICALVCLRCCAVCSQPVVCMCPCICLFVFVSVCPRAFCVRAPPLFLRAHHLCARTAAFFQRAPLLVVCTHLRFIVAHTAGFDCAGPLFSHPHRRPFAWAPPHSCVRTEVFHARSAAFATGARAVFCACAIVSRARAMLLV